MVKKRKEDVGEHFAFDDDTSDSEEEGLEDFQKKVVRLKQNEPPASETSRGQDGNVEESEDDGESDGEESDDEESDDESESDEESDNITAKPESKLSEEKKLKLSKLQEQLAHIGGASDSESENDESEEEVEHKDGANLQMGDQADADEKEGEQDGKDETSEEDGDIESDENQEAEENDQDQPENKKMKLDPNLNSVETGEAKARKKYQEQLSKMSIEEIQKLKERLGLKLFHQKLEGTAPERGKKVEFKRDNKNRPREMSSKKTVGRFREVVQVAKKERRDPRFDPLCGEFNDKLFKESYQFVNEVKSRELVELKKQLKTEEDKERREEVKYLIQRMENQLRAEAQNQVKRAQAEAESSDKKEKLKAGEKPFYLSKAKKKEAELVAKYEELQSKGGLDTFMRKTTKKKDSKERKKGLGVTVK